MMTRRDYEKRFRNFPDVVTINEFRAMLGGIADSTARKLLKEGHVQCFFIRCTYYIPKVKIIDYLLSKHYMEYRMKLKHGIR
ncbi:MAG: DNA-binding protein [Oscillospiraceae bacterium]|nr:DNA-binding protein [Oscillospiraceae bacterium]MBQ1736198.1 DNA-binding protein [Lachnospiraceae bacterium]